MGFIYVFLGGGLGAMARYGIAKLLPSPEQGFPTATFLANAISCIILGMLMGYVMQKGLSYKMQLLAMTGFCGGFSTFSTFSAETFSLLQNGHTMTAMTYIIVSLTICLICIFLGMKIGSGM